MKKEYDFSNAERGKFYHKGATFSFPIYLDKDNRAFLEKVSKRKKKDITELVNEVLRSNRAIVETLD